MTSLWIAAAFALGLVSRRIGMPPLVGFLAAGFALGGLGYRDPETLDVVAHFGVLLLLFTVGLKLRLRSLLGPEVWGPGLLHLAVVGGLLGWGAAAFLGSGSTSWMLGIALGFSSTVAAAKVLEDRRELRAFHGRVAIGVLVVQDVVAVVLITLGGSGSVSPWAFALLGLPLVRPLLARLIHLSGHGELLVLLGLLLALDVGGVTFESVGLSSELGALVLGALLADHPRAKDLSDALWGLRELFLVAFFLSIGMAGLPGTTDVLLALGLCLLLPLKTALFFSLFLLFRLRARTAFLCAISLGSYSEFALIVADLAVREGHLDARWMVVLAVAVAVSFAVAAPLNRMAHELYERLEPFLARYERAGVHPEDEPLSLGRARFLVMGMGRVGMGVYDRLRAEDLPVVGLDSDPGKVQRHLSEGRRVLYADAEDPLLWSNLRLEGVEAVMLALPDFHAKRVAAEALRRRGFRGLISATHTWPEEVEPLLTGGCDTVFSYASSVGLGFAEHTLEVLAQRAEASEGTAA